jgi:hypothetical protein
MHQLPSEFTGGGIPFALRYSNPSVAARRLAAFIEVPIPLPMVTVLTEAVALTW